MRVVLLGPPGAGKGTQAANLSQKLGLAHIASGDLFRLHQQRGTELGRLAKTYMEKGELVPNEITVRMILERVSEKDCQGGFVLDGFPRNLEQAKALDKALAAQRLSVDRAVNIAVSSGELIRRLAGRWICRKCQTPYHMVSSPPRVSGRCDVDGGELYQRADDTEETVRKRLDVYKAQTMPLIEYYRKAGKLVEVNGEQGIDQVTADLLAALKSLSVA